MTLTKVICEHCGEKWLTGQKRHMVICPKCMNTTHLIRPKTFKSKENPLSIEKSK